MLAGEKRSQVRDEPCYYERPLCYRTKSFDKKAITCVVELQE